VIEAPTDKPKAEAEKALGKADLAKMISLIQKKTQQSKEDEKHKRSGLAANDED